jgi:AraC-like DNA-binding protein
MITAMALIPRARTAHLGRIREDYYGQRLLLPELRHLGWDRWTKARPETLGPHDHADGWEICYLIRGQVEWWVGDEIHRVGGGHCYLTRPGERHGGVDRVMHACELNWVQVVLPPKGRLPGIGTRDGERLARAFARMRQRVFPAPIAVAQHFERLIAEHREPDEFAHAAARSALHALLAEVARCLDRHDVERAPSDEVRRAMELLTRRLDNPPAIETVARAVGLGPSRFHERFVAEVGATPLEYLTRRRIEHAQALLRGGASVAETAKALGFTREYFTLAFRKLVGRTPAVWRDGKR